MNTCYHVRTQQLHTTQHKHCSIVNRLALLPLPIYRVTSGNNEKATRSAEAPSTLCRCQAKQIARHQPRREAAAVQEEEGDRVKRFAETGGLDGGEERHPRAAGAYVSNKAAAVRRHHAAGDEFRGHASKEDPGVARRTQFHLSPAIETNLLDAATHLHTRTEVPVYNWSHDRAQL